MVDALRHNEFLTTDCMTIISRHIKLFFSCIFMAYFTDGCNTFYGIIKYKSITSSLLSIKLLYCDNNKINMYFSMLHLPSTVGKCMSITETESVHGNYSYN